MKLKSLLVVALVVGVVGAAPLARAADPNVGNWKFNAEKSKGTMFKSGTSNIEADGDGDQGDGGSCRHRRYSVSLDVQAKYDGKDNPVTGNSPFGSVVAVTHDGPHDKGDGQAGRQGRAGADDGGIRRWEDKDDDEQGYGREREPGRGYHGLRPPVN